MRTFYVQEWSRYHVKDSEGTTLLKFDSVAEAEAACLAFEIAEGASTVPTPEQPEGTSASMPVEPMADLSGDKSKVDWKTGAIKPEVLSSPDYGNGILHRNETAD